MTRADWLLLCGLAYAVGWLFHSLWLPQSEATQATISGPHQTHTIRLDEDREIEMMGPLGASTITIHAGAARFTRSPCRHQVCVRSGWHRRGGAVAACVPNRISLSLLGANPEFDGLSY